jgi:predicted RecB family nuclease
MHLSSSTLQLAASDLGRFLSCRHRTALDMEVAQGLRPKPPVYPDPFLDLLIERGLAHEKAYVESISSAGDEVLDLGDLAFRSPSEAADRTLSAMRKGMPAIAQGLLRCGEWSGIPDVLRRVETPSLFGPWSYEVYDTKLAMETRGTAILQLSLYSDLLAGVQKAAPEKFYVVTPRPIDPIQPFRVADFAAYYRSVRRNLTAAVAQDPASLALANYPEHVDHCDVCRWYSLCDKRRRGDDRLSFVAGLSRLHSRELEAQSITTLEMLGDLALPLSFKPHRGSRESIERVANQARLQLALRRTGKNVKELLQPIEAGRGLAKLPLPSPGDVFLDLEGDHFAREGGREYLFGFTIVDEAGKTRHVKLWAHSDAEEKAAFEKTVDEIFASWAAHPGMHVYHYAHYEPTAFKKLMGRHITRETEIDRMLRAGLFVDLFSVVRQGLRASVEKYSIKDLEKFYGFKRLAVLAEAGAARQIIERALEAEKPEAIPPELRTLVEDYNQEDCVSAFQLRGWLETLRHELEEGGTPVPRPLPVEGEASEKVQERKAEVQKAMDALLAGVPEEKGARSPDQQARWLLAHMLEFHRREDKVTWWEFFRLRDLVDEDDLLDERAVVTGLSFVKRTGRGTKKCPIDRYDFPSQEFEAREGDELFTNDGKTLGTIDDIDLAARWIEVKKRSKKADENPPFAFVHSRVPIEPLPSALLSLAGDLGGAANELLLANAPRLKSGPFARLEGERSLDFAKRAVLALDHSILPIQGPPGAGKTYTGARMIVACVEAGLKVGITAVSHRVIRTLLEKALEAATEMGVSISCIQKIKTGAEKSKPLIPGIEDVTDNVGVLAALVAKTAQVGAGTAWLWSRKEYAGALDVLFVDEAGQATQWLGTTDLSGTAMRVDTHDSAGLAARNLLIPGKALSPEARYVVLEPEHQDVGLEVEPVALKNIARMIVEGVELRSKAETFGVEEHLRVERERFVKATVTRVLAAASRYVADDRHFASIEKIVLRWLDYTEQATADFVEFDPAEVGEAIAAVVIDGAQRRSLDYRPTKEIETLNTSEFPISMEVAVPEGQEPEAPKLADVPLATEATFARGPYRGLDGHEWRKSPHAAYMFDAFEEVLLAWKLDHSSDVSWWFRNEPRRFRIQTPAGTYSPDFIASIAGTIWLIEVKGSIFWDGPASEARLKASAAAKWAAAQTALGGIPWAYGVALDVDVRNAGSWEALAPQLKQEG